MHANRHSPVSFFVIGTRFSFFTLKESATSSHGGRAHCATTAGHAGVIRRSVCKLLLRYGTSYAPLILANLNHSVLDRHLYTPDCPPPLAKSPDTPFHKTLHLPCIAALSRMCADLRHDSFRQYCKSLHHKKSTSTCCSLVKHVVVSQSVIRKHAKDDTLLPFSTQVDLRATGYVTFSIQYIKWTQ